MIKGTSTELISLLDWDRKSLLIRYTSKDKNKIPANRMVLASLMVSKNIVVVQKIWFIIGLPSSTTNLLP